MFPIATAASRGLSGFATRVVSRALAGEVHSSYSTHKQCKGQRVFLPTQSTAYNLGLSMYLLRTRQVLQRILNSAPSPRFGRASSPRFSTWCSTTRAVAAVQAGERREGLLCLWNFGISVLETLWKTSVRCLLPYVFSCRYT